MISINLLYNYWRKFVYTERISSLIFGRVHNCNKINKFNTTPIIILHSTLKTTPTIKVVSVKKKSYSAIKWKLENFVKFHFVSTYYYTSIKLEIFRNRLMMNRQQLELLPMWLLVYKKSMKPKNLKLI